jgi:hypothetical protein|tara:strand:- start:2975 stop:3520 length:546 start_codon:yes stop_codon:yes gene_type:complete
MDQVINYQVIDDFLPEENLKILQKEIMWGHNFFWNVTDHVSNSPHDPKGGDPQADEMWNWYGAHLVWAHNNPQSNFWQMIDDLIITPMLNEGTMRALIRAKVNFYPAWTELKEHSSHTDYDFDHSACVISLNTCNGYTRLSDDITVDSVANRAVIFNGSWEHNSTNCTDQKGRFNINLNYV